MKKINALLLSLPLVLAISSCGGASSQGAKSDITSGSDTASTDTGSSDTGSSDVDPGTSDSGTTDTNPGTSDSGTTDTNPGTTDTGTTDTNPGTDTGTTTTTTTTTSTPDPEPVGDLAELYGTVELFKSNFSTLFGREFTNITYLETSSSFSTSAKKRVEVKSNSREFYRDVTAYNDKDEVDSTWCEFDYYRLSDEELLELNYEEYYGSSKRFKVGTSDRSKLDVLSPEDAKVEFAAAKAKSQSSLASICSNYDYNPNKEFIENGVIKDGIINYDYFFEVDDDGNAVIEYKGLKSAYAANLYTIEVDLDATGTPTSVYFKRALYYPSTGWDKSTNTIPDGASPTAFFAFSVSKVSYNTPAYNPDDGYMYDPTKYYVTGVSGVSFYYETFDEETATMIGHTSVAVGTIIPQKYIYFGNYANEATYTPATALDAKNIYITSSDDESVVGFVDNGGEDYGWTAKKSGTAHCTVGTAYYPNMATITVVVD